MRNNNISFEILKIKPIKKTLVQFMSIMFSIILILTLTQLLFIKASAEVQDKAISDVEDYQMVDENNSFILYAKRETGEVAVHNKKTDETWFSNPLDREEDKIAKSFYKEALSSQIVITYIDVYATRVTIASSKSSVQADGLTSKIENGEAYFMYDFPKEKIKVPVCYKITENSFVVEIISDKIEEYGDDYQLVNVELLPYFGAAKQNKHDGYMFVPDGSGCLINFDNGKTDAEKYLSPIYGKDEAGGMEVSANPATVVTSYNESIRLAVFGMKRDETGFVGIVDDSAARGYIKAMVSGNGSSYNQVSTVYDYRALTNVRLLQREFYGRVVSIPEKLNGGMKGHNFKVKYYFTENEKSSYTDMANIYRKYLVRNKILVKKELSDKTPFIADLYGYVIKKKPFLGVPLNTVIPLTTYEDALEIAKQLDARLVREISIRLNNWANKGAYDKVPISSSTNKKLGGERGLNNLKLGLDDLKAKLFLNAELIHVYKTGNGISKYSDVLKSPSNTPLSYYKMMLDSGQNNVLFKPWYLLSPKKFNAVFSKFINKYDKVGVPNLSLSSIGEMTYSESKTGGTGRDEIPGIVNEALDNAISNVDNLMLERANDFTAGRSSIVVNTEMRSSGYDIIDEDIPFYQIVFHGYIDYTLSSVNLSSSPEGNILKCIETGAVPMFSWVGRNFDELADSRLNNLFSANYNLWLDDAENAYRNISSVGDSVRNATIISHKKIKDYVYETVYSNGVYTVVNYSNNVVDVDGVKIDSQGFISGEVN